MKCLVPAKPPGYGNHWSFSSSRRSIADDSHPSADCLSYPSLSSANCSYLSLEVSHSDSREWHSAPSSSASSGRSSLASPLPYSFRRRSFSLEPSSHFLACGILPWSCLHDICWSFQWFWVDLQPCVIRTLLVIRDFWPSYQHRYFDTHPDDPSIASSRYPACDSVYDAQLQPFYSNSSRWRLRRPLVGPESSLSLLSARLAAGRRGLNLLHQVKKPFASPVVVAREELFVCLIPICLASSKFCLPVKSLETSFWRAFGRGLGRELFCCPLRTLTMTFQHPTPPESSLLGSSMGFADFSLPQGPQQALAYQSYQSKLSVKARLFCSKRMGIVRLEAIS